MANVKQLGRAALKVLWKPVVAAETAWWATSGSDLFHQVHDPASARQFAVAGAVAAGVGALAAIEKYVPTLLGGVLTRVRVPGIDDDTGPGTSEPDADLDQLEPATAAPTPTEA